jgi:hypothetical protein
LPYRERVTTERFLEPRAIFDQPEFPLPGVEPLSPIERVELWLSSRDSSDIGVDCLGGQLFLSDNDTRGERAQRWARVREVDQRCMHSWGLLLNGGPETSWLLDEASHALVHGLWLASLLCCHAACERHLAGILSVDEESMPASWRRWGLGALLKEAHERGLVPEDLLESLDSLNETRKASAHFKPPMDDASLMMRASVLGLDGLIESVEWLAERDAFEAYETARSFVYRVSWP